MPHGIATPLTVRKSNHKSEAKYHFLLKRCLFILLNGQDIGVQTAMVLPLYLGIVPNAPRVITTLLNDISNRQNHLSTGIIGTKYLLLVLSDIGRTDVALNLVSLSIMLLKIENSKGNTRSYLTLIFISAGNSNKLSFLDLGMGANFRNSCSIFFLDFSFIFSFFFFDVRFVKTDNIMGTVGWPQRRT